MRIQTGVFLLGARTGGREEGESLAFRPSLFSLSSEITPGKNISSEDLLALCFLGSVYTRLEFCCTLLCL